MGRDRQPINLVVSKGATHMGKSEIEERRRREVQPCTDSMDPPSYLTKKQKAEFIKIRDQLDKIKIMGETDVDALARYVVSSELYVKLSKQLMKKDTMKDLDALEKCLRLQDKAFRQVDTAAKSLGLTISSRCKLILPDACKEEPKKNKFDKFVKKAN